MAVTSPKSGDRIVPATPFVVSASATNSPGMVVTNVQFFLVPNNSSNGPVPFPNPPPAPVTNATLYPFLVTATLPGNDRYTLFARAQYATNSPATTNAILSSGVVVIGEQGTVPTVTITAPTNTTGFTTFVPFQVVASATFPGIPADGDAVASYELFVNGLSFGGGQATPSFSYTPLGVGFYTLVVRATTLRGLVADSDPLTIQVAQGTPPNPVAVVPAFDSWTPPAGGVYKLKAGLNGSFTVKGQAGPTSVNTTTTDWRLLLEGSDIYGNDLALQLAQGTVGSIQRSTNNTPNTVKVDFAGAIPNDGTLHNLIGTNTDNLGAGYFLRLYFGDADVTAAGEGIWAGTNGYHINVVPDLLIPPVQQVTKFQAGVRADLVTNGNGSVSISSLVVTNPGLGYSHAAPPTFTFTPQGGAATNAAVTNSVTIDPSSGALLACSVASNSYASTVTNLTVKVAAPPRFMTQRTGGVLYGLQTNGLYNYAYNPGDVVRFQTTIANNTGGEAGLNGRPMRPTAVDQFRLNTILTTDPAYQATNGSDDLLVFIQDCAGDLAGEPTSLSEVRTLNVYNTPGPLETYGVVTTNAPATADPVLGSGDQEGRVVDYTVNSPGSYDPENPPPVTVDGDGFGATARAVVDPATGEISAIVPVSLGQGYTFATVTVADPVYGARYYQPRPDDGYLDIGEQMELGYDVLVPRSFTGIYFVGAKVDALNTVAEPLDTVTSGNIYKESPPLQTNGLANNNTFISDIATRLQVLSAPAPDLSIVSQVTASSGAPIVQSDNDSDVASVDEQGKYVVFESYATDLAVPQAQAAAAFGTSLNSTPPLWGATNNVSSTNATTNGVSNGLRQIYRRKTSDRSIEIVSVSSGGAQATSDALNASVNTNGLQIAFESKAANLVDNDTGGNSDIFVRRYDNFRTVRVSVNANGIQGNGGSFTPSISGSGRFVAFASVATNLVATNIPARSQQIYVHDRDVDGDLGLKDIDEPGNIATYLVSVNASGQPADGWCDSPKISEDGKYVTFVSYSGNMPVPAGSSPGDGYRGVVYRVKLDDTAPGKPVPATVAAVSVNTSGALANALSYEPAINGDGSQIAFTSFADNLVGDDGNGFADVFVRDFTNGKTVRASQSLDRFAIGHLTFPVSGLIVPPAGPQTPADNNPGDGDVITLSDGANTVSFEFKLAPVDNGPLSYDVLIGGNASQTRSNLADVINRATQSGNLGILAVADSPANLDPFYQLSLPGQANIPGLYLFCSATGAKGNQVVAGNFATISQADGLTTALLPSGAYLEFSGMEYGGTEGDDDAGELDGVPAGSTMPSIDRTGMVVAFRSTMQTLDVYDRSLNGLNGLRKGDLMRMLRNFSANIYVRNRDISASGTPDADGNTDTKRVSVDKFGYRTQRILGVPTSANSHKPSLSANGRYVAFSSDSDNTGGLVFGRGNFTPQDTNQKRDVFLHDRVTATTPPPIDTNNPPDVTLTEPSWLAGNRLSVGSRITLNALVTDADGDKIKSVNFYVNGVEIKAQKQYGSYYSATHVVRTISPSNLIVARATQEGPTSESSTGTSQPITFESVSSIQQPSSITMLPLPRGTILEVGQPTVLSARVALPAVPYLWDAAIVRFYANNVLIGTDVVPAGQTSYVAQITWFPPVPASGVVLSAVASTINDFLSVRPDAFATLYSNELPPADILGIGQAPDPSSPQAQVIDVFDKLLSRPPNGVENNYWVDAISAGTSQSQMVMQLLFEDEYTFFQNKLFGFYYKMGVAPVMTTYMQRLGLMDTNTTLLAPPVGYPDVNGYAAPYRATDGDAAAAQAIISSAAFAQANPGIQTKNNRDFMTNYFARWDGQLGPADSLWASMNAAGTNNPKGLGAAFINALYTVWAYGPGTAYDYQLKATSLQWLYEGKWTAPTTPAVTNASQFTNFVNLLLAPAPFGFAPQSGAPGTSVEIRSKTTNAIFGSATNVSFNGVPASFAVAASNRITATVPAGAVSGPIAIQFLTNATQSVAAMTNTNAFTVLPVPAFLPAPVTPTVAPSPVTTSFSKSKAKKAKPKPKPKPKKKR